MNSIPDHRMPKGVEKNKEPEKHMSDPTEESEPIKEEYIEVQICENEGQLVVKQESNMSLLTPVHQELEPVQTKDEPEDPEPLKIKMEHEPMEFKTELEPVKTEDSCTDQEEEQLVPKQETDGIMVTHFGEHNYNYGAETNKNLPLHGRNCRSEKPFSCDLCEKSFRSKSSLVCHRRTHTAKKPFSCDLCEKSFSHKHYLAEHRATHKGEKHFSCDLCDKSFRLKRGLVGHRRTHTKPYRCNLCNKSFRIKNDLACHRRTHRDDEPYSCDLCQKSFRDKMEFVYHRGTIHSLFG